MRTVTVEKGRRRIDTRAAPFPACIALTCQVADEGIGVVTTQKADEAVSMYWSLKTCLFFIMDLRAF